MWDYSKKVKDHFEHPRNVGSIDDADGVGEVGSIACGDAMKLYLKLDDDKKIVEAKFQTFGCGSAVASASALTEMIKGKSIEEAMEVTNQDIADYLDGLPKEKMHCSVMGREALEAAVKSMKNVDINVEEAEEEDEGRIVCSCFGVTEDKIKRVALENDLHTVEEITDYTKAGGGCTSCIVDIEDILTDLWENNKAQSIKKSSESTPMTNLQRITMIQKVLDEDIRPALQQDGGDVRLIDVDGLKVKVSLSGACASCSISQVTLSDYVEKTLKELVDEAITVEEAL